VFPICGVICFAKPENMFAGLADILGFLFLTVGVWSTIAALLEREGNPAWWLGLVSGILMILMDIVRAFRVRELRDEIRVRRRGYGGVSARSSASPASTCSVTRPTASERTSSCATTSTSSPRSAREIARSETGLSSTSRTAEREPARDHGAGG
jgi:hypothetical protein